jgi:superfamily II DNA/RNA helicase
VLVATDIAARGIHVDDVALVVHVDPPTEHKAYLHRSGRTARAGAGGDVVTLATPDQSGEVRTLARQAGIRPRTISVRPGSPEITAITGPAAPRVEPAPVVVEQPQAPAGSGGGRRRSRGGRGSGPASGGGRPSSAAPTTAAAPAARTAAPAQAAARPRRAPATRTAGPARTRAELAARAGQQPTSRTRAR